VPRDAQGEDDMPRQIAGYEARRAKYQGARDAAYIDWKAGEISSEQYQSVRVRAEAEIAVCDRELRTLRSRLAPSELLPPWGEVLGFVRSHQPILDGGTTTEQRMVLTRLWESAESVKHGYNQYDVDPVLTEFGHRLLQVAALVTPGDRLLEVYGLSVKGTAN
jgi:hypothetical protein